MKRTLSIAVLTAVLAMTIVAAGGGTVITQPSGGVANNAITDAKLRDSVGLSVIGRSANSSGDPADIAAASDGEVLRRSGTTLGFGAIAETSVTSLVSDLAAKVAATRAINTTSPLTGGGDLSSDRTFAIASNGIDDTLLRDSSALSVIGRASNSSGDPGDIAAASDGQVLRRSGTSLAFGTVATAGIADSAVTLPKMENRTQATFIGRKSAAGTGAPQEMTASEARTILTIPGALSYTKPASPGNTNISTLGDIDWYFPTSVLNGAGQNGTAYRVKRTGGGVLADGFKWMIGPTFSSATTGSNEIITATASDELYSFSAVNTSTVQGWFQNSFTGTSVGAGMMLRVPARTTTQVLRIYTQHFNDSVQMDAYLTDGSAVAITDTDTSASLSNGIIIYTITFNASTYGAFLVVTIRDTGWVTASSQTNIFFGRIQLGTS